MRDTKQLLAETRDRIVPPPDVVGSLERRRRHKERVRRASAAVVGIVVALVGLGGWLAVAGDGAQKPATDRSEDLGIFAPAAGRIVYQRMVGGHPVGLWAVDPAAPDAFRAQVQLSSDEDAEPLGWSSDGTELLIKRTVPGKGEWGPATPALLYILYADGSETQVTTDPMRIWGATISPDGSRVVFASWTWSGQATLYAVDAEGHRPVVLLKQGEHHVQAPTFSPDGTQIAYVGGEGDYLNSVWVMDADGSDAHEIVTNNNRTQGFVFGLTWSPAGDRIALGIGRYGYLEDEPPSAIYTFAPDGSEFTRVITYGFLPYWSPDGSQIAYLECSEQTAGCPEVNSPDSVLAVADADGSNARTFGFAISGPWHPTAGTTR
jgi:Tol biopolymer transport system component